jgi:hypothetical protein
MMGVETVAEEATGGDVEEEYNWELKEQNVGDKRVSKKQDEIPERSGERPCVLQPTQRLRNSH